MRSYNTEIARNVAPRGNYEPTGRVWQAHRRGSGEAETDPQFRRHREAGGRRSDPVEGFCEGRYRPRNGKAHDAIPARSVREAYGSGELARKKQCPAQFQESPKILKTLNPGGPWKTSCKRSRRARKGSGRRARAREASRLGGSLY